MEKYDRVSFIIVLNQKHCYNYIFIHNNNNGAIINTIIVGIYASVKLEGKVVMYLIGIFTVCLGHYVFRLLNAFYFKYL